MLFAFVGVLPIFYLAVLVVLNIFLAYGENILVPPELVRKLALFMLIINLIYFIGYKFLRNIFTSREHLKTETDPLGKLVILGGFVHLSSILGMGLGILFWMGNETLSSISYYLVFMAISYLQGYFMLVPDFSKVFDTLQDLK